MTSLITPNEASNMRDGDLAAPVNNAQRAPGQIDSSAGGELFPQPRIEDYGED